MNELPSKDKFAPLTKAEIAANPAIEAAEADKAKDEWEPIAPVPPDVEGAALSGAPLPGVVWNIGNEWKPPDALWPYSDARGRLLGFVARWNLPPKAEGKKPSKEFSFACYCQNDTRQQRRWKLRHLAPRPLYGLDRLAANPDATVVVCEGEKAADAAQWIFPERVCVTSPGGSQAAKKADWNPVAARKILFWGDADKSGADYAADVAKILHALGCEVTVIDSMALACTSPEGGKRELPEKGWDVANAVEEWQDLAALRKKAIELAKPYDPGPQFVSCGNYSMDGDGLHLTRKANGKDAETESVWICGPFEILGACRDPKGRGWGKYLRWRDADGRTHTRHIADSALQGDPASLCAMLADEGLSINRGQQKQLAIYLGGCGVDSRVTIVHRTGWHEIAGKQVFVLPGNPIGPKGAERVILDASAAGPYEAKGSLEDWRSGIGALSCGHALPVLAISAAFAGPLLYLAGQEGGGLNIFGCSSKGKTTIAQAAASVWGRGSTPGYVRAWRATANGLEGAAASASDTLLILDELSVADARDVGSSLYGLANGAGKARAARDGSLREPKNWRVLFLSTGELPAETKLLEDRGRKARAGQLVRMLDIPTDRGTGFGAFDHAGPDGDPGKLANAFKRAAISAYGTAGPEFVRRIIAEGPDEIGERVREIAANFVACHTEGGCDGQISRAAQRLGLIAAAGELAILLHVTPWQRRAAWDAASWALGKWIEGRGGTEPAEVRQAIEQVRLFIEQHGDSRFEPLDDPDARPVNNRAGWRKGRGADREWWIPPQIWKSEICAGLDATMVAKVLAERKMLRTQEGRGFQCKVNLGGDCRARAYVLKAVIFEGSNDAP